MMIGLVHNGVVRAQKLASNFAFVAKLKSLRLKSAWRQAQRVWECHRDGYPYSIKEISDEPLASACNSLREKVRALIEIYPNIDRNVIIDQLTQPSKIYKTDLGGLSPFQAVLKNPKNWEIVSCAKSALRDEVDSLNLEK